MIRALGPGNPSVLNSVMASFCLLLAGCADDSGPSRSEPAASIGVVHLLHRVEDLEAVFGPLTSVAEQIEVELELSGGEELQDGVRLLALPCQPDLASLKITDPAGQPLRLFDNPAAAAAQGGAALLSATRVRLADQLREIRGSLHSGGPDPVTDPPCLRMHAAGDGFLELVTFARPVLTLRLLARTAAADGCVLDFRTDGRSLASVTLTDSTWTSLDVELAAGRGIHQIEAVVRQGSVPEGLIDPVAELFQVEYRQAGPGSLLINDARHQRWTANFNCRPSGSETIYPLADEPGRFPLVSIGGPVRLFPSDPVDSLTIPGIGPWAWTRSGDSFETALGPGLHALYVEGTCESIRVERPLAAVIGRSFDPDLRLRDDPEQPPTVSPSGIAALTIDRLRARLAVDRDRRQSWWMPTGSKLRVKTSLAAGDRIRFALGRPDPEPARNRAERMRRLAEQLRTAEPTAVGTLLVGWERDDGGKRILDQVELGVGATSWLEREILIDQGLEGPGRLVFETRAADDRLGSPLAVAEPRIVRAPMNPAPTNLIVYLIDTLRADHLSCYGHDRLTSPRLDALAATGFRFERFYASSPWTRPSTASILTGYQPGWHGAARGYPLPRSLETLAESLQQAGYSTWAASSNVQIDARGLQFEQGFQRFVGHDALARREDPTAATSERLHATVLPWLEQHGDEPFFLYLHSVDPHSPYRPPKDARAPFGRDYTGPLRDVELEPANLRRLTDSIRPADVDYVRAVYDNEIEHQDRMIGLLLDRLDQLGLRDNTLVVVLSDHGEEFLEHGDWNHGYRVFEEQIRVPLIVAPPARMMQRLGLRPHGVHPAVSQIDLTPGLLQLLGIDDRFPRQGTSFVDCLSAEPLEPRPVWSEDSWIGYDRNETYQVWRGDSIGALRRDVYKLVWRHDERNQVDSEELFRTDVDPTEQNDLSREEPEMMERMRALRRRFVEQMATVRGRLDAAGKGHVRPAEETGQPRAALDPEALQRLRELGYGGEAGEH